MQSMMSPLPLAAWSLPLGAMLDMLLGDPRGWPHPVRAIGTLTGRLETVARRLLGVIGGGAFAERLAGVVLTILVVGLTGVAAAGVVLACDHLGPVSSLVGRTLLVYWGLAARSLGDETLRA